MATSVASLAGRQLHQNFLFQKKKKRTGAKKANKDKELASSLMVACLKRLLPVGLNLFAGREQEIVQHCKEKFLAVCLSGRLFFILQCA